MRKDRGSSCVCTRPPLFSHHLGTISAISSISPNSLSMFCSQESPPSPPSLALCESNLDSQYSIINSTEQIQLKFSLPSTFSLDVIAVWPSESERTMDGTSLGFRISTGLKSWFESDAFVMAFGRLLRKRSFRRILSTTLIGIYSACISFDRP